MNDKVAPGSDDEKDEGGSIESLFDAVVAKYTGMISRIALAHEADPAIRGELVQDIMVAIWSSLPRFRRESSLKTFVASIAYKRSISHVARAVRRPKTSELSDSIVSEHPLPDELANRNRLKQRMLDAIQALPLAQKQAIILYLEDFTLAEIGEALGISTHAATMRCNRARAALKAAMETRA